MPLKNEETHTRFRSISDEMEISDRDSKIERGLGGRRSERGSQESGAGGKADGRLI